MGWRRGRWVWGLPEWRLRRRGRRGTRRRRLGPQAQARLLRLQSTRSSSVRARVVQFAFRCGRLLGRQRRGRGLRPGQRRRRRLPTPRRSLRPRRRQVGREPGRASIILLDSSAARVLLHPAVPHGFAHPPIVMDRVACRLLPLTCGSHPSIPRPRRPPLAQFAAVAAADGRTAPPTATAAGGGGANPGSVPRPAAAAAPTHADAHPTARTPAASTHAPGPAPAPAPSTATAAKDVGKHTPTPGGGPSQHAAPHPYPAAVPPQQQQQHQQQQKAPWAGSAFSPLRAAMGRGASPAGAQQLSDSGSTGGPGPAPGATAAGVGVGAGAGAGNSSPTGQNAPKRHGVAGLWPFGGLGAGGRGGSAKPGAAPGGSPTAETPRSSAFARPADRSADHPPATPTAPAKASHGSGLGAAPGQELPGQVPVGQGQGQGLSYGPGVASPSGQGQWQGHGLSYNPGQGQGQGLSYGPRGVPPPWGAASGVQPAAAPPGPSVPGTAPVQGVNTQAYSAPASAPFAPAPAHGPGPVTSPGYGTGVGPPGPGLAAGLAGASSMAAAAPSGVPMPAQPAVPRPPAHPPPPPPPPPPPTEVDLEVTLEEIFRGSEKQVVLRRSLWCVHARTWVWVTSRWCMGRWRDVFGVDVAAQQAGAGSWPAAMPQHGKSQQATQTNYLLEVCKCKQLQPLSFMASAEFGFMAPAERCHTVGACTATFYFPLPLMQQGSLGRRRRRRPVVA